MTNKKTLPVDIKKFIRKAILLEHEVRTLRSARHPRKAKEADGRLTVYGEVAADVLCISNTGFAFELAVMDAYAATKDELGPLALERGDETRAWTNRAVANVASILDITLSDEDDYVRQLAKRF